MFTFAATPVTFTGLLILLAFATIWSACELYCSRTSRQLLCNVAHLVMVTVMLVLVPAVLWQQVAKVVSIQILIGIFLGAVVWFGWLGIDAIRSGAGQRGVTAHFFGDATMMGAMAWHLSAMAVNPPHAAAHSGLHAHMGHMGPMTAGRVGDELRIVAVVGLPLMAYLLVSSALNLVKAVRPPFGRATQPAPEVAAVHHTGQPTPETDRNHQRVVGDPAYRLSTLARFAMVVSMFWMSAGFLIPILPFLKHLAF
ncbi:hypothetical protein [Mycobacterium intracellulare]|uniref:hypothetical protein n=1 Tax=Mycobacterium intracellulare TaxID=1767 RepID=UPI00109E48BC|nr:hypothetical protein [Mycobacterium intracellulare]